MPSPWTWSTGGEIVERQEYLTDVQTTPTGEEQRRRLRPSPRTVLSFEALEEGDARRQLEDALQGSGAGDWYAPLLADLGVLAAPWTIGDPTNVLVLDTTFRRFRVGGRVLLISPAGGARVYDVGVVVAVTSVSIELDAAPVHSWPAGTLVMPLGAARFLGVPRLARFTGDCVPLPVIFRLTDRSADVDADAGVASYRGLPVLELDLDWSTDPDVEPARALLAVDNGTGPIEQLDLPQIPLGRQSAQVTLLGREAIWAFRGLLSALAGRWSALWVPSWAQDLRVVAALTVAGTQLDVAWTGLSARALQPNRRDLRVQLADGTVLYRRITAAAALGGDSERLTLDAALGVDADAADVALVSFLSLMRQDSDVNVLRFWTAEVLQTELAFRGFRDDGI